MPYKDIEKRREHHRKYNREYKLKFPEKVRENNRKYNLNRKPRTSNSQVLQKAAQKYRKAHPDQIKKFRLKKYNLTLEEFNSIFEQQRGVCAICSASMPLAVDHNHETDVVRGLLCRSCNCGLGMFKDSAVLLNQAIQYLQPTGVK